MLLQRGTHLILLFLSVGVRPSECVWGRRVHLTTLKGIPVGRHRQDSRLIYVPGEILRECDFLGLIAVQNGDVASSSNHV